MLRIYMFLCVLLSPLPRAEARAETLITAAVFSSSPQDEIVASFTLPCGGRFLGFVIRQNGLGARLGVVLSKDRISCAGMGETANRKVPELRYSSFRHLDPFPAEELLHGLEQLEVTHLELQRRPGGTFDLSYSVNTRCASPVGLALLSSAPVKVAVIAAAQDEHRGACESGSQLHELHHLKGRSAKPPRFESAARPAFTSLFTRIKDLEVNQDGQVKFRYLRHCHDAPIGPLFQDRGATLGIGMVIARYPKSLCRGMKHKAYWSLYRSQTLALNPAQEFDAVRPKDQPEIITPFEVTQKNGLELKALLSCHRAIGLVNAERGGAAHLGFVILKRDLLNSGCEIAPKAVTYPLRSLVLQKNIDPKPLAFATQKPKS